MSGRRSRSGHLYIYFSSVDEVTHLGSLHSHTPRESTAPTVPLPICVPTNPPKQFCTQLTNNSRKEIFIQHVSILKILLDFPVPRDDTCDQIHHRKTISRAIATKYVLPQYDSAGLNSPPSTLVEVTRQQRESSAVLQQCRRGTLRSLRRSLLPRLLFGGRRNRHCYTAVCVTLQCATLLSKHI